MEKQSTTEVSNVCLGPDTKSVERIWYDLQINGEVRAKTRALILDEEKTHAAEVLALQSKRAIIPREYSLNAAGELVDGHGSSLLSVLEGGIKHAELMVQDGTPGADWELVRRKIELYNYEQIIEMPIGHAVIEWSPTDMAKPETERRAQGYSGDTLVRATVRESQDRFYQYNIVMPTADLAKLSEARRRIDPSELESSSAVEMLADFQYLDLCGQSAKDFLCRLEQDIDISVFNDSVGSSVVKMLRKSRESRDAWLYIGQHDDVFDTLVKTYEELARNLPASAWKNAANIARGGAWQVIAERFSGKKVVKLERSEDIAAGADRAVAAGAVFTACGGTIDMRGVLSVLPGSVERFYEVSGLLDRDCGIGSCEACMGYGRLFGCGVFCKGCNEAWCDEYLATGKQLSSIELVSRRYISFARPLSLV